MTLVYALLRRLAGIALRWYYRDIRVCGLERLPRHGPMLVAPNHPNALVDALLVGWVLPRRLLITAKATLFANPVAAWILGALGVLPLRRASDERTRLRAAGAEQRDGPHATGGTADATRNADTLRAVVDALGRGGAVLMFPEGKSWDEPYLAPLRTGAARVALEAKTTGSARGLAIVPVGLVFERKEAPRTRVLVEIGEPIVLDTWEPPAGENAVTALTEALTARLVAVTLNHPDAEIALRERDLAALFAAVRGELPEVGDDRPLDAEVTLARRIAAARTALAARGTSSELAARVDVLLRRADALRADLAARGLAVEDVGISPRTHHGARFAVREGLLLGLGLPVALWGRLHHWLPFRLARAIGRQGTSNADPAMRTIVAGLGFTLLWYALLGALALWLGASPLVAALYLLSLPLAEDVALRHQERLTRARQRMRAFFAFREDPALQARLVAEQEWLREESYALERQILSGVATRSEATQSKDLRVTR